MSTLPTFTTLGSGPTVLMLHGIGGGHLSFAPQVESLASSGYRAVAWDMPGYGHSAPIEPYTFKGLAESCITLIEGLRCDDVVLVGHSMGGMVAQEVVARRPGLVSRLVLCGTSASFGKPDGDWQREFIAQRTQAAYLRWARELVDHLAVAGELEVFVAPEGADDRRALLSDWRRRLVDRRLAPSTVNLALAAATSLLDSRALRSPEVRRVAVVGGVPDQRGGHLRQLDRRRAEAEPERSGEEAREPSMHGRDDRGARHEERHRHEARRRHGCG